MKEHNDFIYLLKFILSLIILLYHSWVFRGNQTSLFGYGYLAVNLYFVFTGYFMMNSLEKHNYRTVDFMKGKIKSLLPGILIAFPICYFFSQYPNLFVFNFRKIIDLLADLFQLRVFGIGGIINAAWWYISVMLFVLFLVYPLARKYKRKYVIYMCPTLILIFSILIYRFNISTSYHSGISFVLIDGFYKGVIYILLGNISYYFSKILKEKYIVNISNRNMIIITVLEFFIYSILILNMHFLFFNPVCYAILVPIVVSITFSGKTYTSKIKSKHFAKLANYGFCLYLIHVSIREFLKTSMTNNYYYMLLKYCFLSFCIAFVVYVCMTRLQQKLIKK